MTSYSDLRARRTADRMIRRRGARCLLRREGAVDRECWACIVDYSPRERSDMIQAVDRLALVSPVGLDVPPDNEKDQLVTFLEDGVTEDEVLIVVAPPGKLQQARVIVYWELQVRPG